MHDYLGTGINSQWARLLAFAESWNSITSDSCALQMVQRGYSLEFRRFPRDQYWPLLVSRDPHKHQLKMEAIRHLIHIRAIKPMLVKQRGTRVYSVFFLVPKQNCNWRAIMDLKWLNKFLKKRKFKMETWRSIVALLHKGDYHASEDLTEAYLHIPVLAKHRRSLRFCCRKSHYQY